MKKKPLTAVALKPVLNLTKAYKDFQTRQEPFLEKVKKVLAATKKRMYK